MKKPTDECCRGVQMSHTKYVKIWFQKHNFFRDQKLHGAMRDYNMV